MQTQASGQVRQDPKEAVRVERFLAALVALALAPVPAVVWWGGLRQYLPVLVAVTGICAALLVFVRRPWADPKTVAAVLMGALVLIPFGLENATSCRLGIHSLALCVPLYAGLLLVSVPSVIACATLAGFCLFALRFLADLFPDSFCQPELFDPTQDFKFLSPLLLLGITVATVLHVRHRRRLESAQRAWLSGMSHDIRTPLYGIIGSATLLQDETLTGTARDHLDTLTSCSHILLAILNNMLDLATEGQRPDRHPRRATVLTVRTRALAAQIGTLARQLASARGITVSVNVGEDVPPSVRVSEGDLTQAIVNLLSNAVKFTSQEGTIRLSLTNGAPSATDHLLKFCVQDNGSGVPEDMREEIFKSFERGVHLGTNVEGAGLGLSITRGIVEHTLGGRVWCTDRQDGQAGSAFWIEVPVVIIHEIDTGKKDKRPLEGLRVVIVDDNAMNTRIMLALLRGLGITDVAEFSSGADTLGHIESLPARDLASIDCIFVDCFMPEMNGAELIVRIRKRYNELDVPPPRLYGWTASPTVEVVASMIDAGAERVLAKPFSRSELRRFLEA
jgi:signal transduction histidine kinase/CheY-like chemotaxis protein